MIASRFTTRVLAALALVPLGALVFACKIAPDTQACPGRYKDLPSDKQSSTSVDCSCPANASASGGAVWGAGVYTTDSNVCKAALHAGAVSAAGGTVTVKKAAGCPAYAGTTANGVTTEEWGAFDTSFYFSGSGTGTCSGAAPQAAASAARPIPNLDTAGSAAGNPSTACPTNFLSIPGEATVGSFVCKCNPGSNVGSVWGSSVYTRDSGICAAATHAGAISATAGGVVTVRAALPCPKYSGSTRNGVASSAWGTFDKGSYYFSGFGGGTCDP
jgi:hypothetical protein